MPSSPEGFRSHSKNPGWNRRFWIGCGLVALAALLVFVWVFTRAKTVRGGLDGHNLVERPDAIALDRKSVGLPPQTESAIPGTFYDWELSSGTRGSFLADGSDHAFLSAEHRDRSGWSGLRNAGFELKEAPSRKHWVVQKDGSNPALFKAFMPGRRAALAVAALPKTKGPGAASDLDNAAAKDLAREMMLRLGLNELNLWQLKADRFSGTPMMRAGITGRFHPTDPEFKGSLSVFRTPTHVVAVLSFFDPGIFVHMERYVESMLRNIAVQKDRVVRPAIAGNIPAAPAEPRADVASSARGKPPSKESTAIKTETVPEAPAVHSPDSVCTTCSGRGKCPYQFCDNGFVTCKICARTPAATCEKCGGTGLVRVENPFTRKEVWDYCRGCYGTGKHMCANRCHGGKLRCSVCGGTSFCPTCRGEGVAAP